MWLSSLFNCRHKIILRIFMTLLSLLTMCSASAYEFNTSSPLAVRSAPYSNFPVIYRLAANTRVEVETRRTRWLKISTAEASGWVDLSEVQKQHPSAVQRLALQKVMGHKNDGIKPWSLGIHYFQLDSQQGSHINLNYSHTRNIKLQLGLDDIGSKDQGLLALGFDAQYRFFPQWSLTPFVSGGLSYWQQGKGDLMSGSDNVFIQGSAGLSWQLADPVSVVTSFNQFLNENDSLSAWQLGVEVKL